MKLPLLLFALLTAPLGAQETRVSILAGGMMSLAADSGSEAVPTAIIAVNAPIGSWARAPRIQPLIALTALPGETLDLADVETFKAIEARVLVAFPLGDAPYFAPYLEGGFATRLPGDAEPRDKTARWAGAGIVFDRWSRGYLKVGVGADQRLDRGDWKLAGQLQGAIQLWQARADSGLEGATLTLVADAILGAETKRDLVRVGIVAGVSR